MLQMFLMELTYVEYGSYSINLLFLESNLLYLTVVLAAENDFSLKC